MAGVCSTYQHPVLVMVEAFLIKIEELTDETRGRLIKLDEISKVAANIENEKGEFQDTPRVNRCIALIKELYNDLLPGIYPKLLTQLSDSYSMIKEMVRKQKEDKSFQLPEVMQVRVNSFNQYLEKAKGQLEVIDEKLGELLPKVSRLPSSARHNNNLRFCCIEYR